MAKRFTLLLLTLALAPLVIPHTSAFAVSCLELGNCSFQDPLNILSKPFTLVIGDFIYPIFWGAMLGILYLKTHSAMLTAYVGMMIFLLFAAYNTITSPISSFFNYGLLMVAVAIGLTVFVLLKYRVNNP